MSVIIIPFIVVMSIFFFKRVSKAYEKYQEQEATLSTVLQENLTGVRVVKAFARQEYEREKFEKENWAKFLRGKRLLTMHALFWPTSDILCGLQMLLGFAVGALMAINGTITVGTYMAYAGLIVWLIFPMRNLGRLIVQTSTGMVSYGRVIEVHQPGARAADRGQPSARRRCARGDRVPRCVVPLSGRHPGAAGYQLLRQAGAVGGAVGRHRLRQDHAGEPAAALLRVHGRQPDPRWRRAEGVSARLPAQQIGIVEQEPFLFSRTIRENITYGVGRDVPDEEVEAAARAAAVHDVILSFPEGYKTLVGEKGVTLSGGQRQRVAIARTLLKDPRILILDDSTSSVDTETEAEIRGALEGLMQGRTTFIIAHRIQSLMNADQIIVLEKGKIIQHGTHDELVAQDGFYRKIYDSAGAHRERVGAGVGGRGCANRASGNGQQ